MRIENRGFKVLALIAFTALCLGVFAYLFTLAGGRAPGRDSYTFEVQVPDAFQLIANGDVRAAGTKVGYVAEVTSRGDVGVVKVEVDKQHAPVFKDAKVRLRTKTLVGENYLELDPGKRTAGELENGGRLPLEQAGEAVQLDEILSSLDAPTRRAVKRNLDALGPGFENRGEDINRLLGTLSPVVEDAASLARVLDSQKEQLARVLDDTGKVLGAVGSRTTDVRALAGSLKSTADAAASRDQQLQETFAELPATLAQVANTTERLGEVSVRSAPVVANLRTGVKELPPVTRRLESAANAGRSLTAILPSVDRKARPLLASLRTFGNDATPLVPAADKALRQLNPTLDYFAPRAEDLASAFATLASIVDTRDATGNMVRVHALFDEGSITGLPDPVITAIRELIKLGGLEQFRKSNDNAYPLAGKRDTPTPFKPEDYKLLDPDPSALPATP